MKATSRLPDPDFVFPGALVLLIGVSLAVLPFLSGHAFHAWLLAGILIGAGLLMLARTRLGTLLLGAGIVYGLFQRFLVVGFEGESAPGIVASVLVLLGLLACLIGQIRSFAPKQAPPSAMTK